MEHKSLRGAIIFIAAFLLFLVITLGYSSLPPGQMIYDAIVGAETDYEVAGVPASLLIVAIFNGVIYGFIIWLIYTLAEKAGLIPKRQKPSTATTAA
jgi:hypothetical protein